MSGNAFVSPFDRFHGAIQHGSNWVTNRCGVAEHKGVFCMGALGRTFHQTEKHRDLNVYLILKGSTFADIVIGGMIDKW